MYTSEQRDTAVELYRRGNSLRTCAKAIGCSHGIVRKWVSETDVPVRRYGAHVYPRRYPRGDSQSTLRGTFAPGYKARVRLRTTDGYFMGKEKPLLSWHSGSGKTKYYILIIT